MDSKLTILPTIPKEWRLTFDIKPTDLNQITSGEWISQVRDVFSMGSHSVRLIGIFYMLTTNKGLNIQGLVSGNQVFGGKIKELEVNRGIFSRTFNKIMLSDNHFIINI